MRGLSEGAVLLVCVGGLLGCGSVKSTSTDAPQDDAAHGDAARIDAAVDAAIDVPPGVTRFEIGYVNDIIIVPLDTTKIFSFLLVVNKGTSHLDLATASVVTFNDDSNGIDWEFSKRAPAAFVLDPNRAAGALGPSARKLIVDDGVVTERIDDNVLDFQMEFLGTPASGVVANAQAVVRINGVEAVLTFKITTISSGPPFQFNSAKRISSQ